MTQKNENMYVSVYRYASMQENGKENMLGC